MGGLATEESARHAPNLHRTEVKVPFRMSVRYELNSVHITYRKPWRFRTQPLSWSLVLMIFSVLSFTDDEITPHSAKVICCGGLLFAGVILFCYAILNKTHITIFHNSVHVRCHPVPRCCDPEYFINLKDMIQHMNRVYVKQQNGEERELARFLDVCEAQFVVQEFRKVNAKPRVVCYA